MAGNSAEPGRSVVSKVIAILHTFTNGSDYTLSEIARLAGLSVSTTYRLATELMQWGFLERTGDGYYRIGRNLKTLGSEASHHPLTIEEDIRHVMSDLSAASGGTVVRLGVLDGLDVAFLEYGMAGRSGTDSFAPTTLPAHATAMGKALLAFAPPNLVDTVIARGLRRYTRYTMTAADELRRSLAVTRLTRVAVAQREFEVDSVDVAMPVFGPGGHVEAALELHNRNGADVRLMRPPLMMAVRCLSRQVIAQRMRDQAPMNGRPAPGVGAAIRYRQPTGPGSIKR